MIGTSSPIVACARGWIGTRFHHQGRLKKTAAHKGGVDCMGLLVGVARELDLRGADGLPLSLLDETDYGHYPSPERLREGLSRVLSPIALAEMCAGDVALFEIDGDARHLAIVTEDTPGGYTGQLGMIHAYTPARYVVEHLLDAWWQARLVAAFRLPQSSFPSP